MFPKIELRNYAIKLLADHPWVKHQWTEMQYVKTLKEWHSHVLSTENRLTAFLDSKGITSFMGMRWEDPETVRLTIRPELINRGGLLSGVASFALVIVLTIGIFF